jgi:hypothetical protein
LSELGRIYFAGLPDAFRRPNGELYRWLQRELDARAVRGIIFRRHPWCDIWHAELARLREWTRLPVLDLDACGDDGVKPLVSGKLQSFLEALR